VIISFDLDNTLIPYSNEFPVEKKSLWGRLLGGESLRKGTPFLFRSLENKGHEIWIYTTSLRSEASMKRTFRSYGLGPSRFINQNTNQRVLSSKNCRASKNPTLFGIDIHIDDLEGVQIEGDQWGFRIILLPTDMVDWTEFILDEMEKERSKHTPPGRQL